MVKDLASYMPLSEPLTRKQRTDITQICEMLINEGVQVYKKDGAKFIQRLVAKQKARAEGS